MGFNVIARWESRSGKRWVEATRHDNGFQWRSSERKVRIGYQTVAECVARAAIEAALMPGSELRRTA